MARRRVTEVEALLTGLVLGALRKHVVEDDYSTLRWVQMFKIGEDYTNAILVENKGGQRFSITVEEISEDE